MITSLYKKSKLGKIQIWSIQVDSGKFCTHEGFVGGQITQSEWTVCKGKNIGRSNETTPKQQAEKEVEAKIVKKKEQGYTEEQSQVNEAAKKISPMLAHKWGDYKDKLKDEYLLCQPKLDGIRCIATKEGLFTRSGKLITSVPHIQKQVRTILDLLPEGTKIDGELYNHNLKDDFNEIISIVRKTKLTEDDLQKSEAIIEYHIYDIDIPNATFIERYNLLKETFTGKPLSHIKLVGTVHIGVLKEDALDSLYAKYLSQGYEGQMVRLGNSQYENSRSKNLLKRKEFIDEEFEILDIIEGEGGRSKMMGRVRFKLKGKKTFDSNARGTFEYFKELLVNKEKYIGRIATVRYQNRTPDGVPRFPVMISVRDYE